MYKKRKLRNIRKKPKISSTKLTNKQNYKLGKQGKLKKSKPKKAKPKVSNQSPSKHDLHGEQEALSGDDVEFYSVSENRSFAKNFLFEFGQKKNRKRRKSDTADNESEDLPRASFADPSSIKKVKVMLPIKSHGKLIPQIIQEESLEAETIKQQSDDNGTDGDSGVDTAGPPLDDPHTSSSHQPILTTEQLLTIRADKLMSRKLSMSHLAHAIIADPYEQVKKLKELREFLLETDRDICVTVRKLAAVTLMEVFVDILPSYKIRLLTTGEEKQAMKKETKKLAEFEKCLLANYRQYLETLERMVKGISPVSRRSKEKSSSLLKDADVNQGMSRLAVRCMCTLLVAHREFNYSANIISVIVPIATQGDDVICDTVCEALKQIFKTDKKGAVSLEIIKTMGDNLKRKNFNVPYQILNTCLSLSIKEIDMSTTADRQREKQKQKAAADKMSRKQRKLNKRKAILDQELVETRAGEEREKTLKMHADVIRNLFVTYFRILKNAPHSVLMPAVLEGLAKFAHLINVEFFDDLFAVFNKLINSNTLQYRELLHCVQTAFTILSGQGSVINIDPMKFYRYFYNAILHVHAGQSTNDMVIILQCLNIMVNQRKRQVSIQRVLAFIKRVCTIALLQQPHAALAALASVRSFIKTYQKAELLYDNETQGSGVFLPELEDPEYCNAQNSMLWELVLLQKYYDPDVRTMSKHLADGAPSAGQSQLPLQFSHKTPTELLTLYDRSDTIFDDRLLSTPKAKKRIMRKTLLDSTLENDCQKIVQRIPPTAVTFTL